MSTQTPVIDPETARHALWHYGANGGYQPGSFTQRLMEAMDAADIDNFHILAGVYPALGAAVAAAKHDPNGIAELQRIAGVRCSRCWGDDGPFTPAGLCEACARPMPLGGVM
ncbi:hypothetical protein [Streptomyces niveus]|uniref:hypothetical protein n=1 Tax=Streptomyces niveus TaxID=193462 RepID=UPI0038696CD0